MKQVPTPLWLVREAAEKMERDMEAMRRMTNMTREEIAAQARVLFAAMREENEE